MNEYQFFISWIPLNLTEARGFITGYTIQWTPYNGGLTNSTIVLPNITNYTSSPVLYPSYKYTVSVLALTVSGNGPPNPLIVNSKIIIIINNYYVILKININLKAFSFKFKSCV